MRIAVFANERMYKHSTCWTNIWVKYLEEKQILYGLVDPYVPDILEIVKSYDIVLWHFSNFVHADVMEAMKLLKCIEEMGIKVFPNEATNWHFDDKIAETYLLQSKGIDIPKSYIFYEKAACERWMNEEAVYPCIAKLRCGSGSNNVRKIDNKNQGKKYLDKIFGDGYKTYQSFWYKLYSKLQSTHDLQTLVSRSKRVGEFMSVRSSGKRFPKERDYFYCQEFIPNDGFDLKVVVVGDKLTYLARKVRKGDFRASGGGEGIDGRKYMSNEVIDLAFKAADAIGSQCMGFDFVIDSRNNKPYVIEMCYGFDAMALAECGGYFDRSGQWHDDIMIAPIEVLENLMQGV